MEFSEKLQMLRKQKGMTQAQLADALYVSRTAVSKWESNRGYPNIESLKAIAKLFSVTVDDLLSGEELLTLAETDKAEKVSHFRDLVFGLSDLSAIMFLFIPFFAQKADGMIQEVSLLGFTEVSSYLLFAYYACVGSSVLFGILMLCLQNCRGGFWMRWKYPLSLLINVISVILFIISAQPYGGAFTFLFLLIKSLLLWKKQ